MDKHKAETKEMKEKEAQSASGLNALNAVRDELERLYNYYEQLVSNAKDDSVVDINDRRIAETYKHAMDVVDNVKVDYLQNLDDRGWNRTVDRLPNIYERKRSFDGVFGSNFIVVIEGADVPTSLYLTEENKWTDGHIDMETGEFTEYRVSLWREFPMLPKFKLPFG